MGRMLEALKRTEETKPVQEPVLAALALEPEEPAAEEMPFIEVGGPSKPGEPKLRLELPAPRPPSLQVWSPQSVALQTGPGAVPPKERVAAELVAFHQPEHPVSQQYAALVAQMADEPVGNAAPVLVLTALAPGSGTTTCLLNLAIAGCKKYARRVVVIDANYLRPAAAARLGVPAVSGLNDLLQGKVALEKAILATSIEHLHVLPGGAAAKSSGSDEAFRWVLAWLGQRFDLILVDAPPWDGGNELRALVSAANAVYLVVDAAEAEKPEVRTVTRELARAGSRMGGLIVTH
jgi:Mrp family chromosome partitioning ATPase